ncbi:MAG: tryptophan synthase subunit alpha [Zetaproteobacteria bacterium CG_4_9_14_3_um_filter_49_83]|nr:MAG: tryptophan synthase subunit alpha [Zetaproteobacteria bacterium CG1_02_49_23]PIQ34427.1 MAG: tryptophan synthase subunit alpha [Zetaproteobacteria bacterium CG17_big_fil_post_rev_8_21_14_2_50_50_13]PIY56410.1 MAG: tryptophan synthase subunit alpha [Zetaproteobacteria bacterium CG_4_10_14_0_8_um_filter_49_80]PJA34049.1 MAG: tryptophan synthase subunit alpha [Zetaproteobacteria bacterium CG_4_9_14_3_um_filter_49_83]
MQGEDRLKALFQRCKAEQRAALVGYLTAGDPNIQLSEQLVLKLAEQVDILEIGMPFSDPMADGPVIQAASERALAAGTVMKDVFAIAKKVREAHPDIGIVLMGYANTPYTIGFEVFARQAVSAGVDGVLLVDIPPEEGYICDGIFKQYGLKRILLLSPTSTDERIQLAAEAGSGFLYYVSLNGITGAEMGDIQKVQQQVENIRKFTDLPVCVGFGIKTPAQAKAVAVFSDGVVVGSHFVMQITSNLEQIFLMADALESVAQPMRQAMGRGKV